MTFIDIAALWVLTRSAHALPASRELVLDPLPPCVRRLLQVTARQQRPRAAHDGEPQQGAPSGLSRPPAAGTGMALAELWGA
ncbi:hypothetical protein, partial [Nonomuraea sp. NPDC049784]|uniref:hypothetical protein n=1 Tax=Nonomuraea sp. NPDC049784 TaxID=3154361 RepID=UPI0033FF4719